MTQAQSPPTPLLDRVRDPADLRRLSDADLHRVADELRADELRAGSVRGAR